MAAPLHLILCMSCLALTLSLSVARPLSSSNKLELGALNNNGDHDNIALAPNTKVGPGDEGEHLHGTSSSSIAESPEGAALHKKHHHKPFDKSIAGAEVIVGGLAAAIFVAIIAYIRVTRKRSSTSDDQGFKV